MATRTSAGTRTASGTRLFLGDFLLMETIGYILLETGDRISLEGVSTPRSTAGTRTSI